MNVRRTPTRLCFPVALSVLLASACGAEPDDPALSIAFARTELSATAKTIVVYFFDGSDTCARLTALEPRPAPEVGPFELTLVANERTQGATMRRSDVPVGRYAVLADAEDEAGGIVASACIEGQAIEDRKVTTIVLVMSD